MKENLGLLYEIAQQAQHLLPLINNQQDDSMDLYRDIMINFDNGERDFKDMVDEFIQLIEQKLSTTENTLFDTKYVKKFHFIDICLE